MSYLYELFAWIILAATTVSSWFVAPQFGGWSCFMFLLLSAILIGFFEIKKMDKKELNNGEL